MKKLLLLFVLAALTRTPAIAADNCSGDLAALRALYDIRQLMMRPYSSSSVDQRVDDHLDDLREPLAGGGYRWVQLVRPSGDGPIVKKEHTVRAEHGTDDHDSFEARASNPFAVRVVVPRKRSLIRGNKRSWIGTLEVRYTVDGREKTMRKPINQWMKPDTTRSFDLGVIADHAEASLDVAAEGVEGEESLVEIHFRQAVAQDDPENPSYDAIQALMRVAHSSDASTIDYEIARFERRLFPELVSTPYTTMLWRVREAEKLMASDVEEEQEKGRKLLKQVTREMGE